MVACRLTLADGPTFDYTNDAGRQKFMRVRRVEVMWTNGVLTGVMVQGPGVREDGSDIPWETLKYTIHAPSMRPAWLVELMTSEGWTWDANSPRLGSV